MDFGFVRDKIIICNDIGNHTKVPEFSTAMKNVKHINRINIACKKVSRSQVRARVGKNVKCYSLKIRVGMYGI